MTRTPAALLLSVSLTAAGPLAADGHDTPLFTLDGETHTSGELPARLALALYEMEFEQYFKRRQLVEDAAFQAYAGQEAAATGRSLEETVASLLVVQPPSEEELRALYEVNRQRINAPFEQVRDRIARFVVGQQREARKSELVAALAAEGRFEPALREPLPPRIDIATEGFPARGAEDATVTVVEFADYQCPYCKAAGDVLEALVAAHPDTLRVVFIDFPINPSGISRQVALGAECARQQDRYWDYHELAFERQRELDPNSAVELARALALEPEAFRECMEDPATAAQVARAEAEALRLGLDSTPSLFIEGRPVILQDIERDLPRVVEQALEAAGAG